MSDERLKEMAWKSAGGGHSFLYRGNDLVGLIRDWPTVLARDNERWCYMIPGTGHNVYFPTEQEAKDALLAAHLESTARDSDDQRATANTTGLSQTEEKS